MLRRTAWMGALAGIIALVMAPVAGYGTNRHQGNCTGKASDCATLIIKLYYCCGAKQQGPPHLFPEEEPTPLRVATLGSGPRCAVHLPRCWGEVLSSRITEERTLRVAPGRYGIAVLERAEPGAHVYTAKEVLVRAGQSKDVSLTIINH